VVKAGVVVETVDLSTRAHWSLGRQPGAVDILAAHDSISRVHAVLQFGEGGELYVTDLGPRTARW
jgi:hypothetical protein